LAEVKNPSMVIEQKKSLREKIEEDQIKSWASIENKNYSVQFNRIN
jgi:hypothetical protein